MRSTRVIVLGLLLVGASLFPCRALPQTTARDEGAQDERTKPYDLVLNGTVTRLYPVAAARPSRRRWAVVARVNGVVSGEFNGETFTFTVHSPAQSGLRVGRSYLIRATKQGEGYVVDELTLEEVPDPKKVAGER